MRTGSSSTNPKLSWNARRLGRFPGRIAFSSTAAILKFPALRFLNRLGRSDLSNIRKPAPLFYGKIYKYDPAVEDKY
jgi:hypothetical protein